MEQKPDLRDFRWDVLLPSAAAVVAVLLIGLAGLASYAFKQRQAFALDGRVLGLAYRVESHLRDVDRATDEELKETLKSEIQGPVLGLCLRDGEGLAVAEVGLTDPSRPSRSIDLFVGPGDGSRGPPWNGNSARNSGTFRGRRGKRILEVFLSADAASPPLPVRLLTPASVAVGFGLVAMAVLGGRFLMRQRHEAEREADQRRLEALGRAGAGLAHQLRNPLATIKGSAQLLGERIREGALRDRAEVIVAQAERMDQMLGTLLDFARPPVPHIVTMRLAESLSGLTRGMPRIQCDIPESIDIRFDRDHFDHIIENLLSNAHAHAPEGSAVEISGNRAGDSVEIRVSDHGCGPGIDPEELFQPYVTHRADGAGLGLTIARTLAEANGGSLTLEDRDGIGTTAVLVVPAGGADQ